jgi:hypothetical protein
MFFIVVLVLLLMNVAVETAAFDDASQLLCDLMLGDVEQPTPTDQLTAQQVTLPNEADPELHTKHCSNQALGVCHPR